MKALLLLVVIFVSAVVCRPVPFRNSVEWNNARHGNGGHHGGGHHPTPGGGGSTEHEGNYVFKACHEDFEKFCPNLRPMTAKTLFESECYKTHHTDFSQACQDALAALPTEPGDGIGTGAGSGSTGSVGTPVYEACKLDQVRYCPKMTDPWHENDLFEASCFRENIKSVSPSCKIMYEKWVMNRHFLLGIVLSGSVMVLAASALSVLTVCCCVALCIRACFRRRCRNSGRKCSWNKEKTPTISAEDVELAPTGAKSVNYEPLPQEEQAVPAFPQTQFYFPSGQQLDPYTAHPVYMQPVFSVAPTQQ